MQSIQSCLSMLKKPMKDGNGGQLAPVRAATPAQCGRVSTRKATKEKEKVSDLLALTTTHSTLGRFSIRSGLKAIKNTIKSSTGCQSAPVVTSAKLGRPQREPHPDPYYGHRRTAVMSARFIHDLFKCSPSFCPSGIPDDTYPTLDKFIAYALSRSECDLDVHYYAMYLIWRMHLKDPELRAHHSHETYLTALMVATKQVAPEHYASESWSEVGQSIYSQKRLLQNEGRLCAMVKREVEPMLVEMIMEQIEMKYDEPSRYKVTAMCPAMESSEWSDEWDDSDSSSSIFSAETPDTSPLPSDSEPESASASSTSSREKAVGECVWW